MADLPTVRFGDFQLDVAAYELRRDGRAVRLERQPMDLLILLVERRGQLVTRAEIVDRLWGPDVFVDVETGVHTAIRKIRQALRDPADTPLFIETVPGKGYRFVAHLDATPVATAPTEPSSTPSESIAAAEPPAGPAAPGPPARWWQRRSTIAAGLLLAALLAGAVVWAWRGESVPESITVAVLPVANLSGEPDREYLADGLAEEMIAALGQVDPDRLQVVARTSTLPYKNQSRSLADIGRDLGAQYIVESSIRAEGGRLRITSKLIRVRDQVQVWSQSFDREPVSVLGLQQELSGAIGEQIRLRLSPDRLDALRRRQTRDPDAYDLYLRGLNFANQRTPPATRRAIEYFTRATEVDPEYAIAWAEIARTYAASQINGDTPASEVLPRAKEAAARALALRPELPDGEYAVSYVKWCCDWDWTGAMAGFRRVLERDPRNAMARVQFGHVLSQVGRHEEAAAETRRARELDPLQPMMHALSSQVAFQGRDFGAALEHARQAISLGPEFWIGYMMRGQAYEQVGRYDLALDALTTAARFSNNNSKPVALRAYVLAKAGRAQEARDVLTTLVEVSADKYIPPFAMALIHAGLNERDAAIEWLERAYEARDMHLMFLTVDPKWDPFRSDPRFESLLVRCGFRSVT